MQEIQYLQKGENMRKTSFIFAGIMSAIIGTAYAVGENTVASKAYVDTKQVKIPVAGTNASTPGESVVTYTDTAGTIGERGIFDHSTAMDNGELVEGHEGDLMPAGEVVPAINSAFNQISAVQAQINNEITSINNQMNAMPLEEIEIQRLTCANQNDGCTLWQIGDAGIAHKLYSCTAQTVATDCPACGTGTVKECVNNICKCVYAECLTDSDCTGVVVCGLGAIYGCRLSDHKCGCISDGR